MKKSIWLFFAVIFACIVISRPAAAETSVNNFTIDQFTVDYYLSKDEAGHSTLKTVEKITAIFPGYDQNHGIERYLPQYYDNHSTNLNIVSITDADGKSYNFEVSNYADHLKIRVGDADKYVHGVVTYVITYTQSEVTKYFSNTDKDEFYWDVNGTGWGVPFGIIITKVHIDSSLVDNLASGESCYSGLYGSTTSCRIVANTDGDHSYIASASNLAAGDNMTIDIPFKANTFAVHNTTPREFAVKYIGVFNLIFIVIVTMAMIIVNIFKFRNARSKNAIIPQYQPPKDTTILESYHIEKKGASNNWIPAMFVDLAIRRNIRIEEVKNTGLLRKNKYILELSSVDNLNDEEEKLLKYVFGDDLEIGKKYTIGTIVPDYGLNRLLSQLSNDVRNGEKLKPYFKDNGNIRNYLTLLMVVAAILSFFLGVFVGPGEALYYSLTVRSAPYYAFFMLLICSFVTGIFSRPWSEKGREAHDYLMGLKMYINIAEEDRLKFLQSVSGAEREDIDINDKAKLVKLYEKILPYAILLGIEKSWANVLGEYYKLRPNDSDWWYHNNLDTFDAAAFASFMSSFSSSVSSSSSFSSSTGGSGGGGFSGGGGGGGGGGGW